MMAGEEVDAIQWFAGLRVILVGLYPNKASSGLTDGWSRMARARVHVSPPNKPFEYWAITDRASAMAALEPYVRNWPQRLIHDAMRANVYRSRFGDEAMRPWPSWLNAALDALKRRE